MVHRVLRGGRAIDLVAFDQELRSLAAGDPHARPFVCDGSPLDCRVFIVGANPATTVPFWPYWDGRRGFDKLTWMADYESRRIANGKPRRSPTRERIERVVAAAAPLSVLETNAFVSPSASIAELDQSRRSVEILQLLFAAIRPDVVLAHGNHAREVIAKLQVDGFSAVVIESKHLSRVGYIEADDLGQRCRTAVK